MEIREDEKLERVNSNISLIRKKNGLTFGTDAYLLAAYIPEKKRTFAVELGGGTGIISLLLLAEKKCARVTAVEVQPEYCELMERNAAAGGFDTFKSCLADVRKIPNEALPSECADVVFSNPPYMKVDSGKRNRDDGKFAARHEVFGDIGELTAAAARCLKSGGSFYAVYRPDRMMDLLAAMRDNRMEPKRLCTVHADRFHKPSLLLVEGRRDGSSGCDYLRPLFLSEPDGSPTEEAKIIYESGNWIE